MPFPILGGLMALGELQRLAGALMDSLKPPAPPMDDPDAIE